MWRESSALGSSRSRSRAACVSARARHLARVEARPQRHVGQQVEEQRGVARQAGEIDAHRVHVGAHREIGADLLDGARQRERIALARTALHHVRHQRHCAGLLERLDLGPAPQQQPHLETRQAAILEHEQLETVRERRAVQPLLRHHRTLGHRRRRPLPGRRRAQERAAREQRADEREVQPGGRSHCGSAGGAPGAGPSSSSSDTPGGGATSRITLRFSSRRYVRATRCTSAAVTAR